MSESRLNYYYRQLVNPGCEESMDEVMWNDCMYEAIENIKEGL